MSAQPDCPDCQGTGWKQVTKDGLEAVVRCGCIRTPPPAERFDRAGLPSRFHSVGFHTFRTGTYQDNPIAYHHLTMASGIAAKFADDFPFGEKKGLLLQGPPGVGKTHLGVAVLKRLIEKGFDGAFFDYHTLLERIRAGYDPSAGASDRKAYRRALDAEVLLLDDLGAHRATDWVYDTVTSIINERYNSERSVIITTNLAIRNLGDPKTTKNPDTGDRTIDVMLEERIGARAVSRLLEMCRIIRISTEDYRLKGARAY